MSPSAVDVTESEVVVGVVQSSPTLIQLFNVDIVASLFEDNASGPMSILLTCPTILVESTE